MRGQREGYLSRRRRRFGYELVGQDGATSFRAPNGTPVDTATVHASVQGDPKKQYELYQFAMSWWR